MAELIEVSERYDELLLEQTAMEDARDKALKEL